MQVDFVELLTSDLKKAVETLETTINDLTRVDLIIVVSKAVAKINFFREKDLFLVAADNKCYKTYAFLLDIVPHLSTFCHNLWKAAIDGGQIDVIDILVNKKVCYDMNVYKQALKTGNLDIINSVRKHPGHNIKRVYDFDNGLFFNEMLNNLLNINDYTGVIAMLDEGFDVSKIPYNVLFPIVSKPSTELRYKVCKRLCDNPDIDYTCSSCFTNKGLHTAMYWMIKCIDDNNKYDHLIMEVLLSKCIKHMTWNDDVLVPILDYKEMNNACVIKIKNHYQECINLISTTELFVPLIHMIYDYCQ